MTWRDDIEQVSEAIDGLAALDVRSLPAGQAHAALRGMNRQLRRLDLLRHRETFRFEASGALPEVGHRTLAQWHRAELACSTHEAGQIGSLARSLAHLPTVHALWEAGDIGADPDGSDPATEPDAHVSRTFAGTVRADATLDPVGGSAVKDLFDEIVDELFLEDWAEAKARLGREPRSDELIRTAKRRRHDAFVEMAVRARAHADVGAARPAPLVSVVTGLDGLADGLAELWDGTPLSPGQLADILRHDPDIQRFTYGSDERPISFNPKARLYTGKLREAILTRDRRCTGRGCERDTRRGAVDHIHPISRGGSTTPTNGRGTCHPCNRSRPRRRFRRHDPRHDPDPP